MLLLSALGGKSRVRVRLHLFRQQRRSQQIKKDNKNLNFSQKNEESLTGGAIKPREM
jgi:hypothetical protein